MATAKRAPAKKASAKATPAKVTEEPAVEVDTVLVASADVLAYETKGLDALTSSHEQLLRDVDREWRALDDRIKRARKQGVYVNPTWLRRNEEYRRRIKTIRGLIKAESQAAAVLARSLATGGIDLGHKLAEHLAEKDLPVVDRDQLREQLKTPLGRSLSVWGEDKAAKAERIIKTGILEKRDVDVVAADLEKTLGAEPWKAKQLATTELYRALRTTLLATWAADPSIVGWEWKCRCDKTACAMCWAMHGTWHPLDEEMVSHPSCRCVPVPAHTTDPRLVPGEVRFRRLSAESQEKVLGPGKYALLTRGLLTFDDALLTGIVEVGTDPDWGRVRGEKALLRLPTIAD